MKEMECKNCSHYMQHYIKDKGLYRPIFCGHCMNKNPNGQFRKTNKICECYKEKDLQQEKDEQLKTATQWLSFIGKQLKEIKQMLKE